MSYKECFMRRHATALRTAKRSGQAVMRPSPTRTVLVHEQKGKGK